MELKTKNKHLEVLNYERAERFRSWIKFRNGRGKFSVQIHAGAEWALEMKKNYWR